jgi:hypothetical protein
MPAYNTDATSVVDNATTGSNVFWGAQLNRGHTPTSYIATTGTDKIGLPISYGEGLLIEPQATNMCLRSKGSGGSWEESNVTATGDADTAPDGTTTATLLTISSGGHYRRQQITVSASTQYTFSFWGKRGNMDQVKYSVFDISNGANIVAPTSYYSQINSSTYTRISVTFTTPVGCTSIYIYTLRDSFPGAGTTTYYWGTQIELGSVATSYIPTLGSTVTRAADRVSLPVSSIPFSTTEGTIYTDMGPGASTGQHCEINIHDGSASNRIVSYWDGSTYYGYLRSGGADGDMDSSINSLAARNQASLAWKANDADYSVDGEAVVSDDSVGVPTGITTIGFEDINATNQRAPTFFHRIVYVPVQVQTRGGNLPTWRYNF